MIVNALERKGEVAKNALSSCETRWKVKLDDIYGKFTCLIKEFKIDFKII
jgi:hypothetical protein